MEISEGPEVKQEPETILAIIGVVASILAIWFAVVTLG